MVQKTKQNTKEFKTFLNSYQQYIKKIITPTKTEIDRILYEWLKPKYWDQYSWGQGIPIPTPIQSAFARIKRPEQVLDKILRKPDQFPDGIKNSSYKKMSDVIGVRIVVYFLRHLPLVDRELRKAKLVELSKDRLPLVYMSENQAKILSLDHYNNVEKESGYRSIHYIVRLKNSVIPLRSRPYFEIQIRTMAQDLWSILEHYLGYKPLKRTNSFAKTQLKLLSKLVGVIDENFNFLYEELSRSQDEHEYNTDEILTSEALPSVLAEIGLSCAQQDINNILKFLYSRGIEKVKQLLKLATNERMEIIRNTYLSILGRSPTNLEIIATLANMRGAKNEKEEKQRIKLQIEYRGIWDEIRKDYVSEV
jgi:putative GTP pyrophosphokinase